MPRPAALLARVLVARVSAARVLAARVPAARVSAARVLAARVLAAPVLAAPVLAARVLAAPVLAAPILAALVLAAAPAAAQEGGLAPRAPEPARAVESEGEPPPAYLRLEVEAGLLNRSLSYSDDLFLALRSYDLPAAFVLRLAVELRPGALLGVEVLRGLAVHARGEWAPGLRSSDGTDSFPTTAWALDLALRWWLAFGPVAFAPEVGYQAVIFALGDAGSGAQRPAVPSLEAQSLRLGGLLRADLGGGVFGVFRGAYLAPVGIGEMASDDFFPRADAGGLDLELEVGWGTDRFEIAAVGEWRRWFYGMNAEPGDPRVAGGAVDDSFLLTLRLRFLVR